MKPKAICYFIIMLLVTGMIACGGDDSEPESTQTEQPATTSSQPAEATPTAGRDIDFAAEEQAIATFMRYTLSPTGTRMRMCWRMFGSEARSKTFLPHGRFGLAPLKKMKDGRQ